MFDISQLQFLTKDLIYYSESDNNYNIISLSSTSLIHIPAEIAKINNTDVEHIKRIDAADFFAHIKETADPNDVIVTENAQKASELFLFLQANLTDLAVYRIENGVRIPIYIMGFSEGKCIGLQTLSIES